MTLARTSKTPGRTQLINIFEVAPGASVVDLPGYGYAKVPGRIRREWGPMIEKYLASRPNLVLSILITDSRHEPSKLDLLMRDWLTAQARPFVIVATKVDKLSGNQRRTNLSRASAVLGKENSIIAYSAITRSGADRIWKEITARIADCGLRIADSRTRA